MFFFAAFTNGLLAVLARVVNAALSDHIGSLQGSLVNHAVGCVVVVALLVVGVGQGTVRVSGIAPIYLSGGILGVLVVAASNYAVRHAGTVLFAVLILAFQLLGSALIDHFGVLGQSAIPLSWTRIVGLGLLIAGATLVVTDRETMVAAGASAPTSDGDAGRT